MSRMDIPGIWDKIQKNVQETELLVSQKKYNLAMIKARQTMEYIVKLQCDKAGMVEGPTDTCVRDLYQKEWIERPTAEHYLQILALGNRADAEGDNSPDNASLALRLLQEEVRVFAGEGRPVRPRQDQSQRAGTSQRTGNPQRTGAPQRTASHRTSVQEPASRRTSSQREMSAVRTGSGARQAQRSRSGRSGGKRKKSAGLTGADLLKLLIPIVLIVILIFVIRLFTAKPTPPQETPTTTPSTAATTEAPTTTAAPETTAPPETEPVTYRTTTTLNVRQGPSTDSSRIGKLDPGVVVDYVSDYDDSWAIIMYNDQQAYVSKEYLTEAGE